MGAKFKNAFLDEYDLEWQKKLVKVILINPQFAEQINEILDVGYFSVASYRTILKSFYSYREHYNSFPPIDMLIASMETDTKESSDWGQIKKILIETQVNNQVDEEEFIKDSAIEFCRKKKVTAAIFEMTDMLSKKSDETTYEEALKLFTNAVNAGAVNNVGHRYLDDFAARYTLNRRRAITTGIPPLDSITSGGLGRGELGLVVGGTGGGKSMFLVYLAAAAMKDGHNVIYYTLELGETEIGRRFDASITTVQLDCLMDNKDYVLEEVKKLGNKLIVKEYPTKQGTVQMIRSHIEKQKRMGWHPDLVIIDYADLLKFTTHYTEMRHNLQGITEELRGLAKEFNVVMWTASQSNREGYKAAAPGLEHLSEAFSKSFSTDLSIVIGRTAKEKANNTAIYNIAKNRNGIDGIMFAGKMDTSSVQITFDDIVDEDYENRQRQFNQHNEEETKRNIAQKYYSDNFLPD